ncbi:hypothetical protein O3P69_014428 [Scylla paramamosain]|uniref:Uncharacterized protein n=1 Tax=Scylla paramamosain TaxID=85552 RepID=A0AAW0TBB4_SCYPA
MKERRNGDELKKGEEEKEEEEEKEGENFLKRAPWETGGVIVSAGQTGSCNLSKIITWTRNPQKRRGKLCCNVWVPALIDFKFIEDALRRRLRWHSYLFGEKMDPFYP